MSISEVWRLTLKDQQQKMSLYSLTESPRKIHQKSLDLQKYFQILIWWGPSVWSLMKAIKFFSFFNCIIKSYCCIEFQHDLLCCTSKKTILPKNTWNAKVEPTIWTSAKRWSPVVLKSFARDVHTTTLGNIKLKTFIK